MIWLRSEREQSRKIYARERGRRAIAGFGAAGQKGQQQQQQQKKRINTCYELYT